MFSDNQKISLRQVRRLLILDLFGISSLLLPRMLAGNVGPDGVFSIAVALVMSLLYLWILGRVMKDAQQDYCAWIRRTTGNLIGDILLIFYLFFFLLLASFLLYQLTGLVQNWLLPEGSYGWITFLLLLVVAYASIRGLEGRARIYEIIFWFLGVPLVIMLILAARGVNADYWTPVMHTPWKQFGNSVIQTAVFFLPVLFVPFLWNHCNKPKRLTACAGKAACVAAGLNIVIYLILLGTFQTKTTAVLERPVITLMSMVKLPGGFFARMDAFMTAIWFFSLFVLLNTGVYYSGHILKELFHEKKTHYSLLVVLIMVFSAARWFWKYSDAEDLYDMYMRTIALPAMLLIPICVWVVWKIRENMQMHKSDKE